MKVTLGKKASIFHDAYLGITIRKDQVVDLKVNQMRSAKINRAINGGFLVRVTEEPVVKSPIEKFNNMVEAGMSKEKIKKAFSFDQLKEIARENDIELEDNDTKDSILEALLDSTEEVEEKE